MKKIYLLLIAITITSFGFAQTATYSFSASGAVTGLNQNAPGISVDANIGFGSFKNNGTADPAINSGQLRLYQNATKGGSIKIYAKNGVTITSVVVNASGTTGPAGYTVDGVFVANLGASTTYNLTSLSATSVVEFYQRDSNSANRIYVDSFTVNYTLASSNNTNSDIIADATFTPTSDINYLLHTGASIATTADAFEIGRFIIRDKAPDDGQPTTLTGLSFLVDKFANIQALAIFEGSTKRAEVTSVTSTTSFSSITGLFAANNSTKTFSVYATFKSASGAVTDNDQLKLTITSAIGDPAGSTFTGNAGGAVTPTAGDNNRIEVTATKLAFNQQPSNTQINTVMTPSPTVRALDVNNNLDLDYVTNIPLTTTGTFAGTATTTVTPVEGVATYNNLLFSAVATGRTLSTNSALNNALSNTFDITPAPTVGWQISAVNVPYTINFDTTVANVSNGVYAGSGFTTAPTTGQLNSNAWAATGWSDGDLAFGGNRTSTSTDYTRGTSTGGVGTGGFYAFNIGGNRSFGIQPGGSDFAPGTITLKAQNQTGQVVTSVTLQYIVNILNDQGRASTFNFSYSTDNVTYTPVGVLDLTSAIAADTTPAWEANPRSTSITTGLSIPDGGFFYLRWSSADAGGSGSRDEFGLDDVGVIFNPVVAGSTVSNIVENGFTEPMNIPYVSYNQTSGLSNTNAIKIGEFKIQDGIEGNVPTDADGLSTTLTNIGFSLANFQDIAVLALFDGDGTSNTNLQEVAPTDNSPSFAGLNLVAPDGGSKVFSIYATFKNTVTDNDQLQLTITSATADPSGSIFADADAGGASTSIAGDDNRIEVTATTWNFTQQPTNTGVGNVMAPSPTVAAVDVNNNIDLDYTTSVSLTTTGTFDGAATTSATPVAGVAIFDNLIFSAQGTGFTLSTTSGLSNATSNTFNITNPPSLIITEVADPLDDFNGRFVEIYNNGNTTIDLGTEGIYFMRQANGTTRNGIALTGTLEPDGILVIGNSSNINSVYGFPADVDFGSVTGSGDDGYFLYYGGDDTTGTLLDSFGELDVDGTGEAWEYTDAKAFRNDPKTTAPNATWTASEWTIEIEEGVNADQMTPGALEFEFRYNTVWKPRDAFVNANTNSNIIVFTDLTSTGDLSAQSLEVKSGATVTIAEANGLYIANTTTNNGSIEMQSISNAYSSLATTFATGTGTYSYTRHVNGQNGVGTGTGNDLISAPFSGQGFQDFVAANDNILTNGTVYAFGPLSKTTGAYVNYSVSETAPLVAGVGYRAASTNLDNLFSFTFTGAINTGNITNNIVYSGSASPEWNLIGNPYPAYIDVQSFLNHQVDVDGTKNVDLMLDPLKAIYGYDGNTADGWVVYNLNTASGTVMAPGQGFLVPADPAKVAAYDIEFSPDMMRNMGGDDFIPGRMAADEFVNWHLKLKATNGTLISTTDFYFNDNSSRGLDSGYDAGVYGSNAGTFALYSHLVQNNTGVDMAIQSLPISDLGSEVIVPIGVNVSQGEQTTISIEELSLPEGIEVYLEDTVTNTFTLLNNADYTFTPSANLIDTGRFFLRFTDQTLSNGSLDVENLQIYAANKLLYINGLLDAETALNIFDIQGRLVLSSDLEKASTANTVDVSGLSTGVYVVKLNNLTQQKTQKVIIK
ncbi:MAG: T9SS type A sorting domain-containing protein [Gelidibacter sp.]